MKKVFVFVGCLLLVVGSLLSCGKVVESTNPTMSTTPASPPAGTTAVKLSGGNVSASGTDISFNFMTLDQDNDALTNVTLGNLSAAIYDSYPTAAAVSVSDVKASGVVTVAFSSITSGSNTAHPIAVTMTLDRSGSMGYTQNLTLETAASDFIDLMSATSQAAIINFDDRITVEASMTSDKDVLNLAITQESISGGSTALFDGMFYAISEEANVSASTYNRAIIAMTDGAENSSAVSELDVTTEAIAQGIPIYTIGLFSSAYYAGLYGPSLQRIAEATTGTSESYFEIVVGVTGLSAQDTQAQKVKALGNLTDLYADLAAALNNAYNTSATLSSSLTAGQNYWLVLSLSDYGDFEKSVIIPFVAQ